MPKPTYDDLVQKVQALEQEAFEAEGLKKEFRRLLERYKAIFQRTRHMIYVHDLEGNFLEANQAALDFLGYSREDLPSLNFASIIFEQYLPLAVSTLSEIVRTGQQISLNEFKLKKKDGSTAWIETDGTLLRHESTAYAVLGIAWDITERKRVEEALRESEAQHKQAQQVAHIGHWEWNIKEDTVEWSDEVYRLFGWEPKEVKIDYVKYLDRVHPEDRGMIKRQVENALKKGLPYENEHRITRASDNEVRVHHTRGHLIKEKGGGPAKLFGYVQDITELKRAEQSLRESTEKFKGLFMNSPDIVAVLDRNGTVLDMNRVVPGYRKEDVIGTRFADYISPEQAKVLKSTLRRVLETRTAQSYEATSTHPEGRVIHWHARIAPLQSEGHITEVIVNATDITERKSALDRLRKSEEKFRRIAETSIDYIFQVNAQTHVEYCSPAVLDILGYTPQEIAGTSILQYVVPSSVDFATQEFGKLFLGQNVHLEIDLVRKDGEEVTVEINAVPMVESGEVVGTQGIARDITERKRVERERVELERQLLQAQKMEAIGTLAGGIAHDFNNVLGIILGNLELATFDIPDWSPARKNLDKVRKACFRARDTVQQILTFSRQCEKDVKPLRLGFLVQESVKMLRATIPTTIHIREETSTNEDLVLADPTRVNQVLVNLCTNAAHAMREKGGVLSVSLTNKELPDETGTIPPDLSPGPHVVLTVGDTGQGMSPEIMERIFEPFYTTKEQGEGTGMGLAMVDGIVKDHGGAVLVRSLPGKGTVFEVFWPLHEAEAESEEDEPRPLPTGKERILFVDDEKDLAEIGKQMLEQLQYEATVETDCLKALALFREDPDRFHLVVTDMTMPHMTGADLAVELMSLRPNLPIILCTGFSEMITSEKAKKMGIREFVMKPLSLRVLAETVRKVLDQAEE